MIKGTPVEKLAYRPREIPAASGLSLSEVYLLISRGELRAVRVGRAIVVPRDALEELLGVLPERRAEPTSAAGAR